MWLKGLSCLRQILSNVSIFSLVLRDREWMMFFVTISDVNECVARSPCDVNANCTPSTLFTIGYYCTCNSGYTGNGTYCRDIDECQNASCKPLVTCTNQPGGFKCGACPQDYLVGNVCQGKHNNLITVHLI